MLSIPLGALLGSLLSPLGIVALSIIFIVAAIAYLRLHAFFSLLLAAALVATLTATHQTAGDRFNAAINAVMTEFGAMAGNLGFSIALAAVIGIALMQSGAADKIVRRLIAVLGEASAPLVLCACSFLLSGPVFVDTVFMLMLPIARALAMRTGRDYTLYVMAIGAGAVVANGVIPPAPGPLYVATQLKIEIGKAILVGLILGIPPALSGIVLGRWINRLVPIKAQPFAPSGKGEHATAPEIPEAELPGFWISLLPVVLPLGLIVLDSLVKIAQSSHDTLGRAYAVLAGHCPSLIPTLHLLGNKNVALFLGATIALGLQARVKHVHWRKIGTLLGGPLETAGIIILIVAAGGAYGAMIKASGVGDQVRLYALGDHPNHPHVAAFLTGLIHHQVLFAWLITAILRGAQGSATVATITGAGIMISIAGQAGFSVHPLYIFLAIGFGSKCLSWMNDAGFWVVSRMSGLTQGEMLRTWSPQLSIISVIGLIEVLILSAIWPQLPF
jgi:gluconate:H+ symporter, GntP family